MITKKFDCERLLEIGNLHSPECGATPRLDAANKYLGYFENCYGEQWVFVGDRKTGTAVICGGDTGWPTKHRISLQRPCPVDLVLNDAEKHWIMTCFMAMSDAPFELVASNFAEGDLIAIALKAATEASRAWGACKESENHRP